MGLTKKAIKKIQNSETTKGKIADLFKVKVKSINRWLDENDINLTRIDALKLYHSELGITMEEALEK